MKTDRVAGVRKRLFDLRLLARIAGAATRRFGPAGAVRQFRRYLKDNRNIVSGSADRYVRRGRDTYAAGALPPLGSAPFLDYLCDEVEAFNARRLAPMVLVLLSVSSRCPYRCRYCYALDQLRPDEAVPVEALRRAVADACAMGVPVLSLTGGEAMLRADDLPVLLEPVRGTRTDVWLVTTGWGLDAAAIARLAPFNLVGVVLSLDSADEARHVRAKGHPDAFRNAVAAARAAREAGLLVAVDTIATTDLLDPAAYRAHLEFLAGLGVHFVNFLAPHRTGGAERFDFPVISTAQFKALDALMAASNRGRANRHLPIAYSPMVWESHRGCVAGQQLVYVDPLGEVRPCPFLDEPIGRIAETGLREIVDRIRGGGERCGCFSMYEGLPSRKRMTADG